MEHHNLKWENQLQMAIFNSYVNYQRVCFCFKVLTYSHFTSGAYVWLTDPLFLGSPFDINDPIIQAVESTMLINQQQSILIYDVNIC